MDFVNYKYPKSEDKTQYDKIDMISNINKNKNSRYIERQEGSEILNLL